MTFNPKLSFEEPNIRWFGAKPGPTVDNTIPIQNAWDTVAAGELQVMHHGPGMWGTNSPWLLPQEDGSSLLGAAPCGVNRFGATTLFALPGSNIPCVVAGKEWYNNVTSGTRDAQSLVFKNICVWGGGWEPQENHDTDPVNSSAEVDYCMVMHGSAFVIEGCSFFSSNLDTFVIAGGLGRNGSAVITESHEGWLGRNATRFSGRDGIAMLSGSQDHEFTRWKIQYAGRHAFYVPNGASAQSVTKMHPSRCGSDMAHIESSWEVLISEWYIDALGDYQDNVATPWRAKNANRYGIWIEGNDGDAYHVVNNIMHTESTGGQIDPVIGIHYKGWATIYGNTLIYQTSDASVTMLEAQTPHGAAAWAYIPTGSNVAHT
jgi:hypothetical protein